MLPHIPKMQESFARINSTIQLREIMGSKGTSLLLILKSDTVRILEDQDSHEKSARTIMVDIYGRHIN